MARPPRGTRDVAAGALVIGFAAAVLFVLSRMPTAKFQAISPALFPRVCAVALIAGGMALLVRGLLREGPAIDWPRWRGTLLVILSVVTFGLVAPRMGYAPAGFLTVLIAGFAARDVKPGKLLVFACAIIAFSVVLFSFVLKVPMPAVTLFGVRIG